MTDNEPDSTNKSKVSAALFSDRATWLFIAGAVSLLPAVSVHAVELWNQHDLLLFPILPIATIFCVWMQGKVGDCKSAWRAYISLAFFIGAAATAVWCAWMALPWAAFFSLTLLCFAWFLYRYGESPWYAAVGWTLPLIVLLSFPTNPKYDATIVLEKSVLSSSSAALDVIRVPNLATEQLIGSKTVQLKPALICRGMGNPYVLLTITLLLLMIARTAPLVSFLVLLTVPAWSWLGNTVHMALSIYLVENQSINVLLGSRNLIMQISVFLLELILIGLTVVFLRKLLTPFVAYSTTSSGIHKFYNRIVYWPAPDPLRKRRSRSESSHELSGDFWSSPRVRWASLALILVMVVAACIAAYRILGSV